MRIIPQPTKRILIDFFTERNKSDKTRAVTINRILYRLVRWHLRH